MDRSTRNLSITVLVVLAIFLGLNHIATRAALADWWLVLLFLLLAVAIWFYDRVSRRGIDDSEITETPFEHISYDHLHQAAAISIPDAILPVVEAPVIAVSAPAPVIEAAPPVVETKAVAPAPAPEPIVEAKVEPPAPAPVVEAKVEPPPPAPVVEQHPPATATVTTSVEEKSEPPTSAAAAETQPEIAAQSPGGIHAPSVPVESADEPVPSPISGSAPEPTEVPTPPLEVPQETIKVKSNPTEVEVSASAAAAAASNVGDPNLPMQAVTDKPDDLKIIEGIGPKMEKALQAAGISTFASLAAASEAQINAAVVAAGMRFAPSIPTWAEQASYAAKGDLAGLEAFQKTLVGGRKPK